MNDIIVTDTLYKNFLNEIKTKIQENKIEIYRHTNRKLIHFYLWLGGQIVYMQEEHGWGKTVVEKLSVDMRSTFPGARGFSSRNLWQMRQFYIEYRGNEKLLQLVAEIPWGHNLLIINKIKPNKAREFYLSRCAEHDKFEVDYALKGLERPVGVANYQFTRQLPKEFIDNLPDPKLLEKELNRPEDILVDKLD